MSLLELFQNIGIFGISIAAIAWLIKKIFNHFFKQDLERFKSNLEKEAIEFKIKYERLHDERVEVIKKVYKKISQTYKSFHSLMCPLQLAGEPTIEEKQKEAVRKANDLVTYYEENKIFFEREIAKEIDSLLSKFKDIWGQFQIGQEQKKSNSHKESLDSWNSAWKQIEKDVPKIKEKLENRFRDIIGIE